MANTPVAKARVTEIRTILCAVDFSEFSASVLAYAAAFARLFGSEITVLHVVATVVPPANSATLLQVPEARQSIAELHRPYFNLYLLGVVLLILAAGVVASLLRPRLPSL